MGTPGTTTSDWRAALQPILDALEIERKSAQQTVTTAGFVIAAITIIVILFLLATQSLLTPLLLLFPLVLGVVIFAYVYSNATSTYKTGFRNFVLPKLVETCAHEAGGVLEYSQGEGIGEAEFKSSGLFRVPDRYHSEDLIVGKIGETKLRFSEVHAEYRTTRTDSKGHTHTEYHTIFKGLFFVADFNKNFSGTTVVLPDTMQSLFGRFGQKLQEFGTLFSSGRRELVRLEDPHFEQAFVVYSNDQTEARYILSPALMQRLLAFRTRCNTDLHVLFSGGNMTLAIPMGAGWLEPPSLSTPITLQSLELCLQQLRFACSIVSDLDLNTRIWSK
jgi:hypothetical protein